MNGLRAMLLIVTLSPMLVFIGGMTFALVMAFGMNFITYSFRDRIFARMYRAQQVTEEEPPELLAMFRRLVQQAELA